MIAELTTWNEPFPNCEFAEIFPSNELILTVPIGVRTVVILGANDMGAKPTGLAI